MKKYILICSVLLLSSTLSFAQQKASYKQTLEKMMQVTGAEGTYKAVIDQMISNFKVQKPNVPASVWTEFGAMMTKAAFTDIVDLLLPIYEKHFTEADLKGVISFYETPVGQKLALESPMVARESMQAGQQWGQKLAEDFMKKLQEKGY